MGESKFATEAELVAAFCVEVERLGNLTHVEISKWRVYHETAGWDLLLVDEDGVQLGVEAKLSLNAKVLEQALPGRWVDKHGPDYRAVLVPQGSVQRHLEVLAGHVGITVIQVAQHSGMGPTFFPALPEQSGSRDYYLKYWFCWCPEQRCKIPDYVPDVEGGKPAPVRLTEWKVNAIKLMILLDRRQLVTRADMRALNLSPSRWTDRYNGFLEPGPGGYVRNDRTPDFRAQHPVNFAEIEADFDSWAPPVSIAQGLFAGGAPDER